MGYEDYKKIFNDIEKLEEYRNKAIERVQVLKIGIAKWELEIIRMENMIEKLKKEVGK